MIRSASRPASPPAPMRLAALLLGVVTAAGCGGREGGAGGAGEGAGEGAARAAPPPPVPSAPWFEEVAAARGLRFAHDSGAVGGFLFPEISCGGAALFDMDGDGDLDAYFVQSGAILDPPASRPPNRLFRNRGDGTFDDVTAGSGADDRGIGMGVAAGDFDDDGLTDLYVTNVGANVLLRNLGDGTFRDVTATAGVGHAGWGSSAAFLDGDADGDLDLFVVNYINWSPRTERECFAATGERDYCAPNSYVAPAEDVYYRNDGNGTFTDVSAEAGLRTAFGNGLGIVCGDMDGDGAIDVYVANDGMKNQLWMNRGDGTFRDEAAAWGTALDIDGTPKAGMGVTAADVDDDGDLDLLVVNLVDEADSFYRNEGGYFADDTTRMGLRTVPRLFTRFGMALHDFDNDGRLDLFEANGRVRRQGRRWSDDSFAEPNVLLRGGNDGFEEVLPRGGTRTLLAATSRAAAFGDVDGDGGIDVLVVNRDGPAHLLRNTAPDRGHWLRVRLLDGHGRDALGAKLALRAGDRTITREARSAYSYCAANDPRIHVGLGGLATARDLTVRWPDGTIERFGDAAADRDLVLRRGEGEGDGGR